MMTFALSSSSKERREGVDSKLIAISDLAITISTIDFGIPADGGIRTAERQMELFAAGKSKADGYNNLSYHQSGRALDFYAYVDGAASWKKEHLAIVAAAMLQAAGILGHKIRWGGLFKSFQDMPHIQLIEL